MIPIDTSEGRHLPNGQNGLLWIYHLKSNYQLDEYISSIIS